MVIFTRYNRYLEASLVFEHQKYNLFDYLIRFISAI